jgi:hypothetical protein
VTIGVIATRSCGAGLDAKRAEEQSIAHSPSSPGRSDASFEVKHAEEQTPGSPTEQRPTPRQLPASGSGDSSLSPNTVFGKIMTAYMAGLKRCYKQYLNKSATARGAVLLSFTVSETGRLVNSNAKGFAAEIDICITAQMTTWRFPVPRNKDNEPTNADFQLTLQLVPD